MSLDHSADNFFASSSDLAFLNCQATPRYHVDARASAELPQFFADGSLRPAPSQRNIAGPYTGIT
jgi:hypothetical protein